MVMICVFSIQLARYVPLTIADDYQFACLEHSLF